LLLAGCGTTGGSEAGIPEGVDLANGKALFINGKDGKPACGSCHTLADAGTKGTVGPNLDDAFGYDRKQGFDESSFYDVTHSQIELAAPPMPDNLVTGRDAVDVAAYVAAVAGAQIAGVQAPQIRVTAQAGGGATESTDGKTIFQTAGCASCHTLKDAGASGTVGPNLDEAKPSKNLAVERVTNGMGAMPPFKDKLTAEQIQAVAEYVSSVAGK
jgi:cytochrome c6